MRRSDAHSRIASVVTPWLTRFALASALAAFSSSAFAQLESVGKGLLTVELGRASAPVGGIAAQVASPGTDGSGQSVHANAFRFLAGYHFAEFFSVELGLGRMGTFHSSAPYLGNDILNAADSLLVIEGDLVGHLPIAPRARINFTVGISDTSLHTSLTTEKGSDLAIGQTADENDHRMGATAGLDFEWRLGEVMSVLVGYHVYPHIGSSVLRDSASGTATGIFAGLHFEF